MENAAESGRLALEEALGLIEAGTDPARAARLVRQALAAGVDPDRAPVACEACKGEGKAASPFKSMLGMPKDEEEECLKCRGRGTVRPFWPRLVTSWGRSDEPLITQGWREPGYVAIRPCAEEHGNKTFIGYLIGDVALSASVTVDPTGRLEVAPAFRNPAIFVFALGKVIYGAESWWGPITGPEDLKDIDDATIDSVWYVQMLRTLSEKAGQPG